MFLPCIYLQRQIALTLEQMISRFWVETDPSVEMRDVWDLQENQGKGTSLLQQKLGPVVIRGQHQFHHQELQFKSASLQHNRLLNIKVMENFKKAGLEWLRAVIET